MKNPPDFPAPGTVLKLDKALYNFKRSPLLWQTIFTRALKNQGFQEVPQKPYVVIKGDIICFFFVNNIVFAFKKKDQPNVKEIVNALKRKFRLEELRELKWFLKMHIFRDRDKRFLWLFQQTYIKKLATTYTPKTIGLTSSLDISMLEKKLFPAPSDIEISEEERRAY